jgi:hypothetical protein
MNFCGCTEDRTKLLLKNLKTENKESFTERKRGSGSDPIQCERDSSRDCRKTHAYNQAGGQDFARGFQDIFEDGGTDLVFHDFYLFSEASREALFVIYIHYIGLKIEI